MTGPDSGDESFAPAVHLLTERRDVVLFCRTEDGAPIGYPMRSIAVTDDGVHFTTYRKSVKVAHLERDPRVSLLAFEPTDDDAVDWVEASGTARIWSPTAEQLDQIFSGPRDPRVPAGTHEHVRARILDGRRIVLTCRLSSAARHRSTLESV